MNAPEHGIERVARWREGPGQTSRTGAGSAAGGG